MNHPSVTDLADLAPTSDPDVLAHVRTCADCRELAALAGVDDAVLDRPSGRPPADRPSAEGYSNIAEIERGGMGRVLVARHLDLGREVLLKSMLPADEYRSDAQRARLRRRFEREVRLTARLQHPGIVPVYEAGRFSDGEPYYAMPRIAGRSLSAEIATRKTAAERLALVPALIAACEAVAYAHDRGVVHRDLKPDNVLVGAFGETVVIDWGLARIVDETGEPDEPAAVEDPRVFGPGVESVGDGLTRLGVGTAAYMPPEQVRGEVPDARADVYALGATLFHVLAGEAPHAGVGATTIRRDKIARAAALELPEDIPAALRAIVLRATATAPAERFPSALELAAELRRFQTGQLTHTHRYSARELLSHFVRRHRAAVRIGAAATVVLIALAIVGTWRIARERDRAQSSRRLALVELDRARGATALALSHEPLHRLEAVIQGVLAVGAPHARGESTHPDASRGLLAALAAGPAAVELAGGAGGVGRLAAFPDGTRVAVSGADGHVQLYDLTPPRLSASHVVDIGYIWGIPLSPDQRWLGVHGQPGYAVLLELATGRQIRTAEGTDSISCGAWIEDATGVRFVTGSHGGTATEWTLEGRALRTVPLAAAATIARSRNDIVAVGDVEGNVAIWRGDTVRREQLMPTAVTGLAFDTAGRLVVTHHGGEVWRLPADPASEAAPEQLVADPRRIFLTAWLSPSGRWLMMPDDSGSVVIHDLEHRVEARVRPGLYAETATPFTADETAVVLSDATGLVQVWELESGRKRTRFVGRGLRPDVIAVLPDDRFVLVDRRGVSVVDARYGAATGGLAPCTGAVVTGQWAASGTLAIACGDGDVRRYDARGAVVDVATLDAPPTLLASDDDSLVAGDASGNVAIAGGTGAAAHAGSVTGLVLRADAVISAGHDGTVRAVSRTGEPRWTRTMEGAVRALAAHPDGSELAAVVVARDATDGGPVHAAQIVILKASSGDVIRSFSVEVFGAGEAIAWPRADRLVVSGFRQCVIVTADGAAIATVTGRAAAPGRLDANVHGFVTAGSSGSISTYDLDGRSRLRHAHHGGATTSAQLGHEGSVVSSAADGSVVRVDSSGVLLQRIDRGDAATWAASAPDGSMLAAGYNDGTVRVEQLTETGALERACGVIALFGETARVQGYCDNGATDNSR